MNQMDEGKGTKYMAASPDHGEGGQEEGEEVKMPMPNGAGLENIPETQDWSEQTPPGTAKKHK